MATINEIIYDVREKINQHIDDSDITDRYIIHKINLVRNKFLQQRLDNFRALKGNNILQKFCTKLEKSDSGLCERLGCEYILKSKDVMPQTLELHNTQSIFRIKPTDILSKKISFISLDRLEYVEGSSFQESLYAFIDTDDYLYIFSPNGDFTNLDCLEITGIFSNPLELENYKNCCNCNTIESCYDPYTDIYPMYKHLIFDLVQIVSKEIIEIFRLQSDKENNSDEQ